MLHLRWDRAACGEWTGRWVTERLQQGKEQDLGCSWVLGHGLGALG